MRTGRRRGRDVCRRRPEGGLVSTARPDTHRRHVSGQEEGQKLKRRKQAICQKAKQKEKKNILFGRFMESMFFLLSRYVSKAKEAQKTTSNILSLKKHTVINILTILTAYLVFSSFFLFLFPNHHATPWDDV